MSDRSAEQQASDLAVHARLVLDNPAFVAAMKSMHEANYDAWRACPIRDVEGMVLLQQVARITDKFEATLRGMLEAGKLADAKLDTDDARSTRKGEPYRRKSVL